MDLARWGKRKAGRTGRAGLQAVQVEVGGAHPHTATRWKRSDAEARAAHHEEQINQKVPLVLKKMEALAKTKNPNWAHVGDLHEMNKSLRLAAGHLLGMEDVPSPPYARNATPQSEMKEIMSRARDNASIIMGKTSELRDEPRMNWGHVGSLHYVHDHVHRALNNEELKD